MGCNNSCSRCHQCSKCNQGCNCGGCGNENNRRGCRCLANDVQRLICDIKRDAERLNRVFDELEDRGCIRNEERSEGCGCNRCNRCNQCHRCNRCNW